jgi:hypothetical protein
VNGSRDQFLSGSGLTPKKYICFRCADPLDLAEDITHLLRLTHDVFEDTHLVDGW